MIYILSHDTQEIPKLLDDKSLDSMIKDIAQVLFCFKYPRTKHKSKNLNLWVDWAGECKANYLYLVELGLKCSREYLERYTRWVSIHNLDCDTKDPRKFHKTQKILEWARDNVPDLPSQIYRKDECGDTTLECGLFSNNPTTLPILVPKKYQVMRLNSSQYGYDPKISVYESYREYYKSKMIPKLSGFIDKRTRKQVQWTNRSIPEFLNEDALTDD